MTVSAAPLVNAYQGGTFILYIVMEYIKTPITIPEQIAQLKLRGMVFNNDEWAEEQLRKISYFRLASYWRPMEMDKVTHTFKSQSSFENAMSLYMFDKELRSILFTAIQTIEIALRTKVIQHISMKYGSFWFADATLFANSAIYQKSFANLLDEMSRSKEDFLTEHFSKYDTPPYPPAWKIMEIASFGTLAKMYSNLKDVKLKKKIAKEFGLPQHVYMESWMKSIAALRNCIAHHARVWNRKYPIMPQLPERLAMPWIAVDGIFRERVYALLCILQYMHYALHEDDKLKSSITILLGHYPNVDVRAMGFPKGWRNEPLWQ